MAIYRLQIEPILRGEGHSSVGAAAYRAGERLRDDRTNEVHNHSRRKDVTHSEIMLPSELRDSQNMEWAKNRASLWNSVENAESRKDARVAREIQVNLPHELPPERRVALARAFSQEVADHYKVAVDLAVHEPRPSGDPRNHHAHLLMTTREVSPEGLGAKAGLELSRHERMRLGLPSNSEEFTAIRARWATVTNEALKEANIEARVDHRSLAEQGIDREPRPHIPFAAYKIERAGQQSDVAESIRADYAARVQARLERQATHEPNAPAPQHPGTALQQSNATQAPASPASQGTAGGRSLDDVRREARENWLKLRATHPDQPSTQQSKDATSTPTRAPDNDQTL
jgi:ATP-dependent exoDNAse (exonuclease V) alpha subunit